MFLTTVNGTGRARTGDPGLMNPLLYQLSYSASRHYYTLGRLENKPTAWGFSGCH